MRMLCVVTFQVLLGCCSLQAHGEDIELYLSAASNPHVSMNVLFILDNTDNWARADGDGKALWGSTRKALGSLLRDFDRENVRVGFLLYRDGEPPDQSGGYVRSAMRTMTAANAALYAAQIEAMSVAADTGTHAGLATLLAEAYYYFSGSRPVFGAGASLADYVRTGPEMAAGTSADRAVWSLPGSALAEVGSSSYLSPVAPGECARNRIIIISHGPDPGPGSATHRAHDLLELLTAGTSQSLYREEDPAVAWSRFLAGTDLGIKVSALAVGGGNSTAASAWRDLLADVSAAASGEYIAVASTPDDIELGLRMALSDVEAEDGAFVAPGLPADRYAQGVFLNHVYSGQFRPDEFARPRWPGNLKQYRLGKLDGAEPFGIGLVDAGGNPVLAEANGRIDPCAVSYWTPPAPDNYWAFLPSANAPVACKQLAVTQQSNFPDGGVVEKGGQAYIGRGGERYAESTAAARVVKTAANVFCGGSTGATCGLLDFDVNDPLVSASMPGAEGDSLRWARGADTEDEDRDGDRLEFRPSLHSDVLHSRPLAIDISADAAESGLVVFYGANDGLIRAINGNRYSSMAVGDAAGVSIPAGAEFWAFMPAEFFSSIGKSLLNAPSSMTATTGSGGALSMQGKVYGPDGSLVTWLDDNGRRFLAASLRRGGRTVYVFDISDMGAPRLLWRLGCAAGNAIPENCAPGWDGLGQTWSTPVAARVTGEEGPYLLMGGGYDTCEDNEDADTFSNHDCGAAQQGNMILVLDAATGRIIRRFDTLRSVPGRLTQAPISEQDRSLRYAYAADTGGNVYRLSGPGGQALSATSPPDWELTRIAALGCGETADADCSANRKFLFGPDVVAVPNSSRYAVLLGSGDREKPTARYAVTRATENYFYVIFDQPQSPDWLETESQVCNQAVICGASLAEAALDGSASLHTVSSPKGWKLKLKSREQVVSDALTIADSVYFQTHRAQDPANGNCQQPLGSASRYRLDFRTGAGDYADAPEGGLLPGPVAGKVKLDTGEVVPFCLGCAAITSSAPGLEPQGIPAPPRFKRRLYWRINRQWN